MRHRVITTRKLSYPFTKVWKCVCGYEMKTQVFGLLLEREFKHHLEQMDIDPEGEK